ncbi:hypothetical protein AB0I28_00640 [Phytomonospora sp. NPDC050363]|uniref:hypothetical protein n=1 Tax=Phytomonospora sp. NPDC050363 TaxID=3155642 RepID=UPI0033C321B4
MVALRRDGGFDHVVIGSGFCALAFAERLLTARPHARIRILERGQSLLPDHFQNLPRPDAGTPGGLAEIFLWRPDRAPGAVIGRQSGTPARPRRPVGHVERLVPAPDRRGDARLCHSPSGGEAPTPMASTCLQCHRGGR